MKISRRYARIIAWCVFCALVFFLATAAIGWLREKRDVEEIRALFAERELQIKTAVAEVGSGVPLKRFNELLPNASFDEQTKEFTVWIPSGYDEDSACINTYTKTKHFKIVGDDVRPFNYHTGRIIQHCDRFGPGGVWYYFMRAWYSSAKQYKEQNAF